jgi:outer membrane protein TolC
VAVLALCAPATAQDAPDELRVVTLDEAIRLALRASPTAVAADVATRDAELQAREALGDFLPSLNLGSTFANSSNERFDAATGRLVSESYSAQATASYEIFSFGRRIADRRAASARLGAAAADEIDQDFAVALATTEAFYGVAGAVEQVRVAERRLERARAQLEAARVRLELEAVPRSDVLRAELEVGNAELAVLDARVERTTSALRLGRQTGLPGEVLADDGALPETAPGLPELQSLVPLAEASAPPVQATRARLRDRSARTFSAYTQYAPSLRINGGLDWFAFDFPPRDRSWNLRLTLSVPLFDGFAREGTVARARAQERLARIQHQDAVRGARVNVEDAYRRILAAEQRVTIAGRGVELAREDLRVQEERYELGVATILDLQASQVALADAENTWVLERQELGLALARLESVLGRPLEELST